MYIDLARMRRRPPRGGLGHVNETWTSSDGYSGSHVYEMFREFAVMYDNVHKKSVKTGLYDVGACYKFSAVVKDFRFAQPFMDDRAGGPPYRVVTPVNRPPSNFTPESMFNILGQFPDSAWHNTSLAAWTKYHTQIPEVVSVANFLFELKDFRSLIESIGNLLSAKKKVKFVNKALKKAKKAGPRGAAKAVNDNFLQYSFAWAPLIGDLQRFTQLVDIVSRRLDWLRKNNGKLVRMSYQKSNVFTPGHLGQKVYSSLFAGELYSNVLVEYEANFASTAVVKFALEGLDDAWSIWKAGLRGLGLNNPLKIAWNAIPFSFLVDWIIPISRSLEKFAAKTFDGLWVVDRINTSVTERAVVKTYQENYVHLGNPIVDLATTNVSRYTRIIGLPVQIPLIDFSRLGGREQALFSSLLLSKVL